VGLYGEKPYIREQLKKYGVAAATNTLDGVTFLAKDWEGLITALRIAKTADGFDAFAEGRSPEKPAHWALDLSMAATIGKGFREIWRLSDRPLSTRDLPGRHGFGLGRDRGQWSDAYSAQFGKDPQPLDITSLHFAVAADRVNVHTTKRASCSRAQTVRSRSGRTSDTTPAMNCSGRPACPCRAGRPNTST
jgi:hypothetical protein